MTISKQSQLRGRMMHDNQHSAKLICAIALIAITKMKIRHKIQLYRMYMDLQNWYDIRRIDRKFRDQWILIICEWTRAGVGR